MTDSQTHRLERLIRETTVDLRPGSPQMRDRRESLMAELTAIAPFVPRADVLRLETLIERLTGVKR